MAWVRETAMAHRRRSNEEILFGVYADPEEISKIETFIILEAEPTDISPGFVRNVELNGNVDGFINPNFFMEIDCRISAPVRAIASISKDQLVIGGPLAGARVLEAPGLFNGRSGRNFGPIGISYIIHESHFVAGSLGSRSNKSIRGLRRDCSTRSGRCGGDKRRIGGLRGGGDLRGAGKLSRGRDNCCGLGLAGFNSLPDLGIDKVGVRGGRALGTAAAGREDEET
jgi:hypothetical protein